LFLERCCSRENLRKSPKIGGVLRAFSIATQTDRRFPQFPKRRVTAQPDWFDPAKGAYFHWRDLWVLPSVQSLPEFVYVHMYIFMIIHPFGIRNLEYRLLHFHFYTLNLARSFCISGDFFYFNFFYPPSSMGNLPTGSASQNPADSAHWHPTKNWRARS